MISYNQQKNELEIKIPVNGIAELYNYQNGLLGILKEIQINECSNSLKENLKSVYKLLSHLLLDQDFLNQHELLLSEYKEHIINRANGKVKESS
ncbi:hypothetical protein GCM10009122_59660 [Fulvivirga kasyanovii]|uniref:Uncharacterized protein n=1 Tax=Fulvivirga kasyanovii TaxID=396812 RepID=A0ABW9RL28_9BACT|nr:hypothetical protein [Fulvivirga kasyanovii]MTI24681.1 hypothetical protein [Fulvivirga kasyanovii]